MFRFLGNILDSWWPFVIGGLATVSLAFAPSLWPKLHTVTPFWAWTLLVVVSCVAIAGQVGGAYLANKRSIAIEADLLSSLNTTLVPLFSSSVEAFNQHGLKGKDREILINSAMQHARAYVTSRAKEKVIVDANYYRLDGDEKRLTRQNAAFNNARSQFEKTRGKQPRHLEENQVVESVIQQKIVFCPDVQSRKHIERLSLENQKTRNYSSFLTFPFHEGSVKGMLSINSDKKGAIHKGMTHYLKIVSKFIATLEKESGKS